jgi:hypothetical protein
VLVPITGGNRSIAIAIAIAIGKKGEKPWHSDRAATEYVAWNHFAIAIAIEKLWQGLKAVICAI